MIHNKYYEIMKEFLKGYQRQMYGREFIEKVSISQKNIALTLIELAKKGILAYKTSGNRKYYHLNFSNPLIKHYLILFEEMRKIEFFEKNKELVDFLEDVNADLVCVFGSYAKERHSKDSDIDILVVGKVDSMELIKKGDKYGINVQVFNISFKDFEESVKNKSVLIKEVLNNHVLIKGSDKFIEEVLKWTN